MTSITVVFLLILVFIASWLITAKVRSYALKAGMIDIPNQRSSHTVETPRGGGISIVISFLIATVALMINGVFPGHFGWPIIVGVILVAVVGFWDDHGHVSAKQRIVVHFIAAFIVTAGAVFSSGGMFSLTMSLALAALFVFVVWMLNLYNFMDGIDGIAVVEGVSVAIGAALLLYISGYEGFAIWVLVLSSAIAGFGYWNWPPAQIFMGDAASGSLGFIFGSWALLSVSHSIIPIWTWLILLGVFVVDATLTLLTRLVTGQRWYEAHRSHSYQNLSRKWKSHLRVTVSVLLINTFWLLPMAYWSVVWKDSAILVCLLALSPLVLVALYAGSGRKET